MATTTLKVPNVDQIGLEAYTGNQERDTEQSYLSGRQRSEQSLSMAVASNSSRLSPKLPKGENAPVEACQMCIDLCRQIQSIAYGIDGLLMDVGDVEWAEHFKLRINQEIEDRKSQLEPVKNNCHQLITWILETIEATARILSLAQMDSRDTMGGSPHAEKGIQASYFSAGVKRKSSFLNDRENLPLPSMNYRSSSRKASLNYVSDEDWNRKLSDESPTSHSTISNTENVMLSTKLLQQMSQESRFLPPLPPPPNSSLLSLSPPLSTASTTHMAYLQGLQNQISSRILAYETLQREHQSLLSAFARSQTQVAALDKKVHATDAEIKDLYEGRANLEAQVESLEAQIEEMQQSKDDAHDKSVAKDVQYTHIMAMSTKLEAQGVSDSKKWKAERQRWELERKVLMGQIAALKTERSALLCRLDGSGAFENTETEPSAECINDIGILDSHRSLQKEVEELRTNCQKMQSMLQALHQESGHLDEALEKLGGIRKHLQHQSLMMHGSAPPLSGVESLDYDGEE